MFLKVLTYQCGQATDILLLPDLNIDPGRIKEVQETYIEERFNNAKVIVRTMHDLYDILAVCDRSQCFLYGFFEEIGRFMVFTAGKEIYDVIFLQSGKLHNGYQCDSLGIEIFNVYSQYLAFQDLMQDLYLRDFRYFV